VEVFISIPLEQKPTAPLVAFTEVLCQRSAYEPNQTWSLVSASLITLHSILTGLSLISGAITFAPLRREFRLFELFARLPVLWKSLIQPVFHMLKGW
jgi:hypothetical protein